MGHDLSSREPSTHGEPSSESFWARIPGPDSVRHPERIGDYLVRSVLGEGGSGVVYLAEQENPPRTVALKIVRPGLATARTLRRFELEARILGRLQHPGIAQIHEAGMADFGYGPQPFFAMEYVRGLPIVRYATENGLGIKARLALVLTLCEAVHYAHLSGIVHRDLTPANILVDECGRPRVLDFGVARATEDEGDASSLRTQAGQVLGTLPYMSPEQVTGAPQAVDARTDVYALGVIAYELLTGRLPCDVRGVSLAKAAEIICEQRPLPASALDCRLRGDVETILAKALEKDRERRYASVSDLAGDVKSFLEQRPISARPASVLYVLRTFARRNRGLVAGVALALTVLIAGTLGTTAGMLRARQAEADLRERYLEARAGFEFLLENVTKDLAARAGSGELQRPLLEELKRQIERHLRDDPEDPTMLENLAGVLESLGTLESEEDRIELAERHQQSALRVREELAGHDPGNPAFQRGISLSSVKLGDLALQRDALPEAQELYERAFEIDAALAAQDPDDQRAQDTLCWSYERMGDLALRDADRARAEKLFRRRHALATRILERDAQSLPARHNACASHICLFGLLIDVDLEEAERHASAALSLARELVHEQPTNRHYVRCLAAGALDCGRVAERRQDLAAAYEFHLEAARAQRYLAESAPSQSGLIADLLGMYEAVAMAAARRGDGNRARQAWQELIEIGERLQARAPVAAWPLRMQAQGHFFLGEELALAGSEGEARTHADRARELYRQLAALSERSGSDLLDYANFLLRTRTTLMQDPASAVTMAERALLQPDTPQPQGSITLGHAALAAGDRLRARAILEEVAGSLPGDWFDAAGFQELLELSRAEPAEKAPFPAHAGE